MRGLSGEEGVIIPVPNVRHLMLKKEVAEAIAAQKFFVYAVATVDEAVALLTDLPAGERGADGNYLETSLNGRVEATLVRFAQDLQAFEKSAEDEEESDATDA